MNKIKCLEAAKFCRWWDHEIYVIRIINLINIFDGGYFIWSCKAAWKS